MDTDLINSNQKDKEDFDRILNYINGNNYEFIFFNKNIEDVLEIEIKDSKIKTAEKYYVKNLKKLESNNYNKKGSNLHIVIDRILKDHI